MRTRRSPALVGSIAALLLVATGCGLADDRPASDYGTVAEALRALPAVTSVDGPHLPADEAADETADTDGTLDTDDADDTDDAEDATAFTVALDEEADAAALRSTGDDAFALVNDYRYPDGPPQVTLSSGPFTGEVPVDTSSSCNCVPAPENIDLGVLPLLHTLPDVSAGRLGESGGTTQIELDDGIDARTWAEDAAATTTSARDHDGGGVVRVETVPTHEDGPRYRLDLGPRGTAEAVRTLHDAADDAGATVATAEITVADSTDADATDNDPTDTDSQQSTGTASEDTADSTAVPVVTAGELTVAEDADTLRTQRTLLEHFDAGALGTVTVEAASGLSIEGPGDADDLDDVADAITALADAEVTTTSADAVDDTLTAHADDAEGLRAAAQLVSSPDWPLESDADVTVKHSRSAGTGSVFRAADWPDHVGLVAGLWEPASPLSTSRRSRTQLTCGSVSTDRRARTPAPPTAARHSSMPCAQAGGTALRRSSSPMTTTWPSPPPRTAPRRSPRTGSQVPTARLAGGSRSSSTPGTPLRRTAEGPRG